MRLRELRGSGRAPRAPLTIELPAETAGTLRVETWLRILPGQRYVGVGDWQGRRVLAKFLVGSKAARHFARELQGARLLAAEGLVTPVLLAQGAADEGAWLLFDFLEGAESLGVVWSRLESQPLLAPEQAAVLDEALGTIAALHRRGLWQADLHLDNLLRHQGRLYLVDGGGVRAETPGQPLSAECALTNLALFLAQLPAALEPHYGRLLERYLELNPVHRLALGDLRAVEAKRRAWRLRDYLKKVARDCTLFSVRRGAMGLRAVRRELEPLLEPLLEAPDAFIEAGVRYKNGGTATVAGVALGGRQVVIKRYNIKNLRHRLTRLWRPSRAWHSWCEGHRLEFLGIATPAPLAVLEERWLWLRGRAYVVNDYLAGEDIIACFEPYVASAPPEALLAALDELFATLIRARISHGDLKGTNVFWRAEGENGRWALIDLDAMRQHRCARRFERAYQRDRARFLRNWPAESVLYRVLDARLPKSSLGARG